MKFQIIWNAFFKVKNEEKADRLINQIEVRTGHPIVSKLFERSKKEPSLLGVTFVSKLKDEKVKGRIWKSLCRNLHSQNQVVLGSKTGNSKKYQLCSLQSIL